MTVLEAHGVNVAFAASMPVLKDVSFVLEPRFYGLVGANGAGKTTLLRVLAGELAHEGSVRARPKETRSMGRKVVAGWADARAGLSTSRASRGGRDRGLGPAAVRLLWSVLARHTRLTI